MFISDSVLSGLSQKVNTESGLSQKDNELSLRKWRDKQKVCSGMHLLFRPPSACRTAFAVPGMLVCGRNIC